MTCTLIPLALNELLDRPLIVSFNVYLCFTRYNAQVATLLFMRSVSNARIQPTAEVLHQAFKLSDEKLAIRGRLQ
jgi:hypothetical protein